MTDDREGWKPVFDEARDNATLWQKRVSPDFALQIHKESQRPDAAKWAWSVVHAVTGELDARFACSNLDMPPTDSPDLAMRLAAASWQAGPHLSVFRTRRRNKSKDN